MNVTSEAIEAAAKGYFENCDYAEWDRLEEPSRVEIRADLRAALEAARPYMQERITTAERLQALQNCDRNVIVIDEDGTPFQNLWGGWKTITMASFFDSERLYRSFGPRFTVIHIGPEAE